MSFLDFWTGLLHTFQASPDWIKALWIVSIPAFWLGVLMLILRYRAAVMCLKPVKKGKLAYSIMSDESGFFWIYTHQTNSLDSFQMDEGPVLPLPLGAEGSPNAKLHAPTSK